MLKRDRRILYELVHSKHLWEQRIAIITTIEFIKYNQFEDTLQVATILLQHRHALIHKAVGWALREIGKKDKHVLISFLDRQCTHMPRTMLPYAIEHFNEAQRKEYLARKN